MSVADYIRGLAREHNVRYVRTPEDALADVITSLSGNEVIPDEAENLRVTLKRAGVIDESTCVLLLGNHLDERNGSGNINLVPGERGLPLSGTGVE